MFNLYIGSIMLGISLLGCTHTENQMVVLIGAIWGASLILKDAIEKKKDVV